MRLEREKEGDEVKDLYGRVFGEGFPDYGRAANLLRKGREHEKDLSFVMRDDRGVMVGSVRCTKIAWVRREGEDLEEGLMMGPLAILPELRGIGLGKRLVNRVLNEVGRKRVVITIGDVGYFVRLDFWILGHDDLDILGEVRPFCVMVYGEEKREEIVRVLRYGEEYYENRV